MTFKTALTIAAKFGAKPCRFNPSEEVAGCWIDRIELLAMRAERGDPLGDYIDDANRYA